MKHVWMKVYSGSYSPMQYIAEVPDWNVIQYSEMEPTVIIKPIWFRTDLQGWARIEDDDVMALNESLIIEQEDIVYNPDYDNGLPEGWIKL